MTGESMYEIEKNIPISVVARSSKYPLKMMEVGDSFFVPLCTQSNRSGIWTLAKRDGVKLASRKQDGGLRFWRIA